VQILVAGRVGPAQSLVVTHDLIKLLPTNKEPVLDVKEKVVSDSLAGGAPAVAVVSYGLCRKGNSLTIESRQAGT
jgi:hypothetical protein